VTLRVEDLKVYYRTLAGDVRALDGVTFSIADGEIMGLAGESGCGKSTLGRAILGLLPEGSATSGEILFHGRDLTKLEQGELRPLRGPELGLVFQEPMTRLDPLVTIERHFLEALAAHRPELDDETARRRSLEALGAMGIPPTRFRQYPHEFSGGMRQRIMIALALVLVTPPPACRFHPRCPDAMRVCAERHPVEVELSGSSSGPSHRVSCWLHGPDDQVPPGGDEPLEREEIAAAEEA
jgi:ABC-type dipeptide/oligopeptide/nickel transport system ATPase component